MLSLQYCDVNNIRPGVANSRRLDVALMLRAVGLSLRPSRGRRERGAIHERGSIFIQGAGGRGHNDVLRQSRHVRDATRLRDRDGRRRASHPVPAGGRRDRRCGRLRPHDRSACLHAAACGQRLRQRRRHAAQCGPGEYADRQYRRRERLLSSTELSRARTHRRPSDRSGPHGVALVEGSAERLQPRRTRRGGRGARQDRQGLHGDRADQLALGRGRPAAARSRVARSPKDRPRGDRARRRAAEDRQDNRPRARQSRAARRGARDRRTHRREQRRRSALRDVSVLSPGAGRRPSAGGADPLRIRSLPQIPGTVRATGVRRRAVSGRDFRLPKQADAQEPAGLRALCDGLGGAGSLGRAEGAWRRRPAQPMPRRPVRRAWTPRRRREN